MLNKRKKKPVRPAKLTRLQRYSLFFFDHLKTSVTLWIAVVIFGVLSYTVLLQRQGFPAINLPFSVVNGVYFVDNQAKVDADVAEPASKAIMKLSEVKTVTATSGKNFVSMQIEYKEGADAVAGSAKAQQAVEALHLPSAAKLQFQSIDFSKFDNKYNLLVSAYSTGNQSPAELNAQAQSIAKQLTSAKYVTGAEAVKQTEEAIDPATGLSKVQQKTFDRTAVQENGKLVFHNSVSVGVLAEPGTDTLKLYDSVHAKLATITTPSVQTVVTGSEAESVREQISGLQKSLTEGLIIVAIISLLLISWRAGIATSLSMATVLLATIGGLKLFGYSLNTITLFALILSLGLIVDDTTIVAEAIDAGVKAGQTKREIVQTAIKRVARASTTGTLVTMLAFAPMIFIGGILGSFIRALPITIILSLAFSLIVSLSLIPFLAKYLILTDDTKAKHESRNPVIRAEHAVSSGLAGLITWTRGKRLRKAGLTLAAVVIGIASLLGSFGFFSKLKFDIFPPTKDGNEASVTVRFAPGTSIEQAQAITDKADTIIAKTLGSMGERVDYMSAADSNAATAAVILTPFQGRGKTAPTIQKELTDAFADFPGANVKVSLNGAGGPTDDQPFKVQINTDDAAKAAKVSKDIVQYLNTSELKRPNGTTFHVTNAQTSDLVSVTRKDGQRVFEVSAGFDAGDVTALVTVGKTAVEKEFPASRLQSYGLAKDALKFDFGNESENQDSFKSMLTAFPILILAMLILLVIQFRSLLQPLLILLAIPFSFLGVAFGLFVTDNSLSFFVMVGFFALIGIAVNNTIMLVDYANQALKAGNTHTDAIAEAVRHRFRPLLTTSLTSIVALTPLAMSDPFWQPLAVTLIFGLISSTFLVIVVFPYFWLIAEWLRVVTKKNFRRFVLRRPA